MQRFDTYVTYVWLSELSRFFLSEFVTMSFTKTLRQAGIIRSAALAAGRAALEIC